MINLLPKESKVEVKRRYRLRLVSVGLFAFSVAILVLGVMLVPTYFIFSIKSDSLKANLQDIPVDDRLNVDEAIDELSDFAKDIKGIFPATKNLNQTTSRITSIIEVKPAGIHIDNLSASKDGNFNVRGRADKREDIINFVEILETFDGIRAVDSPIANLVAETDGFFEVNFSYEE